VIAPALLVTYAVVMGGLGARQLRRARWPQRSPRLGIWAWQALSASVLIAALLAGVTLAVPSLPVGARLASLVDACWLAIREQYSTPGGAVVASLGVLVVLAMVGRLGFVLIVEGVAASWRRRVQRRRLLLVAQRDPDTGALVVPHATPAVYCLAGRRGVVVCTSAAVAALDMHQFRAVLAHERAHLHRRHDLVLSAAAVLQAAFPFIPGYAVARAELGRLVEMQADDSAAVGDDRRVLATALVRLAEGAIPVVALGAGGTAAFERFRRLSGPADPLSRTWSSLAAAAAVTAVMLPLLIAVGPGVVAAVLHYCPLGFPPSMR
jgi:Zn-dependent protease with chaperone function